MKKTKVLIVDDSPVYRALLSELIGSDPDLEVIATAEDPFQARDLIKQHNPDVLTLDIEMPKMNGVQFLKNLMRLRPMPVVMISTLTQHGAEATLAALEYGAVDYFPKPSVDSTGEIASDKKLIIDKVKMAAGANVSSSKQGVQSTKVSLPKQSGDIELIAIGASTGGTEAIKTVLSMLPKNVPPIIITQHISALFSTSFAERLNANSDIQVKELTVSKAPLVSGCAYLAPGDKHLVVIRRGTHLYCQLDDRPAVNRHKPSVDVMFDAVSETVGDKSIGVILTGMGQDGAKGMLRMKQQGAKTIAQDQASSVVWGMPRVATELGAAQSVVSLNQVAGQICHYLSPDS
ncbi:chemotaxis response regulator protein-glutamate methylesterase [Vibrio sp. RE86]|uniref:protein-glutamate methylesterase/protein-glutamine glutaminase n=1 Tax=Vibrio sp. RE86 TaxID=2607605 RepID=UPI001493BDF8|nr:chemotaxis response regulator protein-glutamate methylesterase [Vibrio sp. RE86]NOH78142.1 chemotaxis response regulator protein-glutamate methylesterase [Vibrio sp. RE86]